ncbi:hypothetical protein C1645_879654 [Glomus cerebriforme]|uniref:Uncharacterized protein n=1 Tax=Glomus cerebriforme TaxID=658196 RepID=A0A397SQG1_9GLOM|nr:hypothetical protein C1645_879654 [Glomus cerebriforme]
MDNVLNSTLNVFSGLIPLESPEELETWVNGIGAVGMLISTGMGVVESLERFNRKTKKVILEWYKIDRKNNRNTDDEEDDLYIDPIFVWDDNALATRSIQKNAVITLMQEFNGLQPIQTNLHTNLGLINSLPSDSIFSIMDTQTGNKQQIAEDLVRLLGRTYYQANIVSLGRVYQVEATRKGCFEVREYRDVF